MINWLFEGGLSYKQEHFLFYFHNLVISCFLFMWLPNKIFLQTITLNSITVDLYQWKYNPNTILLQNFKHVFYLSSSDTQNYYSQLWAHFQTQCWWTRSRNHAFLTCFTAIFRSNWLKTHSPFTGHIFSDHIILAHYRITYNFCCFWTMPQEAFMSICGEWEHCIT